MSSLTTLLPVPAAKSAPLPAALRFGALILLILIIIGASAPLIAWATGHGMAEQFRTTGLDMMGLPLGPSQEFWLGTDGFGRDVMVRTAYGLRISLLIGLPATTLALVIGTLIGLLVGWSRGWGGIIGARLMDMMLAFPFVLTALALATLNRGADGLPQLSPPLLVTLVISSFSWIYFARLTSTLVRELRNGPMVEAALVSGASRSEVIFHELLPIIASKLIIFWAVQLPINILAEATLSFLGVGIAAPAASLGNMISEAQKSGLYQYQIWTLLAPGMALFATVAAANLLAAGLRSHLDPQAKVTR